MQRLDIPVFRAEEPRTKIRLLEIERCRRGISNIPMCSFRRKEQGRGEPIDPIFEEDFGEHH